MNELGHRTANTLRRKLIRIWRSRGGGYYGFVVLLMWVYLEVIDIAGDVAALPRAHMGLGFLISFAIGNIVDALLNAVRAAIWPVSWISHFGVGLLSAGVLAASYVLYRAVRPGVLRLLTPTDEPTASAPSPRTRS